LTRVSVIIPAYNAMTYLPKTIDSVLQQTLVDFEILIINDGSSDPIVEWFSQRTDPRIKLISQSNQGVSVARNTGLTHAKGEYIAFLDADDLWEPNKLERQVHYLEDNPTVGLVHTWMALIDQEGKPTGRVMTTNAEGEVWAQLAEKNAVACSSVMARRCCFEKVGTFFTPAAEVHLDDWDMWIRIAKYYHFAVLREPLLFYRKHPNNGSNRWKMKDFQLVIERAFEAAPPNLLFLKNRSYGHANFGLAWKALQSDDRDYEKAHQFRKQALSSYPSLRYSREHIRLGLALSIMRWFGPEGYSKFLSWAYALRRSV
jgi:glycosyltransferase involved in cell wall biosynthesis